MRITASVRLVVSGLCLSNVLAPTTASAWQAVSPGLGLAVALAPGGDVVAGGDGSNLSAFNAGFKVVRLAADSGAERWQYHIDTFPGSSPARAVAVDAAGDVLAAGAGFVVVKLTGSTGIEVWRTTLGGNATSLALDRAGDVVVGGSSGGDFVVVKLAGATGDELWRATLDGTANGPSDVASAVAVDATGDVVAAGSLFNIDATQDVTVIKLVGSTGAELWRHVIISSGFAGSSFGNAVAIHGPSGDIIAAGRIVTATERGPGVVRLAAATGGEVWRYVVEEGGRGFFPSEARAVAVDGAGDVAVGGWVSESHVGEFTVAKVAGATGTEIWRRAFVGNSVYPLTFSAALAVAEEPGGDIIGAGFLGNIGGADFMIARFSGGDGAEIWRRVANDRFGLDDLVRAVAIDAAGDVLAVGDFGLAFMVEKIHGSNGRAASSGCPAAPPMGCRTAPQSTMLLSGVVVDQQRIVWKWAKGATAPSEFGDPLTTTDYQFCVYDDTAGTPRLVLQAPVLAGGICDTWLSLSGTPCWKATGTAGFKYASKAPLLNGISTVTLKAESAGLAKMSVKGTGANLALPPALGLVPPVVVQLESSDGPCWVAEYGAGDIVANRASTFAARK